MRRDRGDVNARRSRAAGSPRGVTSAVKPRDHRQDAEADRQRAEGAKSVPDHVARDAPASGSPDVGFVCCDAGRRHHDAARRARRSRPSATGVQLRRSRRPPSPVNQKAPAAPAAPAIDTPSSIARTAARRRHAAAAAITSAAAGVTRACDEEVEAERRPRVRERSRASAAASRRERESPPRPPPRTAPSGFETSILASR